MALHETAYKTVDVYPCTCLYTFMCTHQEQIHLNFVSVRLLTYVMPVNILFVPCEIDMLLSCITLLGCSMPYLSVHFLRIMYVSEPIWWLSFSFNFLAATPITLKCFSAASYPSI